MGGYWVLQHIFDVPDQQRLEKPEPGLVNQNCNVDRHMCNVLRIVVEHQCRQWLFEGEAAVPPENATARIYRGNGSG